MKKIVLLGTALVVTAMLMFSCNKNRFDFDNLESINVSGQWNLPLGSANISLGDLLTQFGANNLIQNDEHGNYYLSFGDTVEAFNASKIWSLLEDGHDFELPYQTPNPILGSTWIDSLNLLVVDTLRFHQDIMLNELNTDETARVIIDKLLIESCFLKLTINELSLGEVQGILMSSPDIHKESNVNDTLSLFFDQIDFCEESLADYVFDMNDYAGSDDACIRMNYGFIMKLTDVNTPELRLKITLGLRNLVFKELSAYVTDYVTDFAFDTTFSIPFSKVNGAISLVGTQVKVDEKSTFMGLDASLMFENAYFYGNNASQSNLFDNYPFTLKFAGSAEFENVLDETMTITYNTGFNRIHMDGVIDVNHGGLDHLVTIYDNSSIVVAYDVMIPFKFNVDNVSYCDTMALSLADIEAPDIVKEINLYVTVESLLPFDLNAQIFTLDKNTGMVTDSLLSTEELIKGVFENLAGNPTPVKSDFVISVSQDRVKHLMASNQIIMRFTMDTEDHEIWLNSGHALGVALKADVSYDGDVKTNQF